MTKRIDTEGLWTDCSARGCKRQVKRAPNKEFQPGHYFHDPKCIPASVPEEHRAKVRKRRPLPAGWQQVRHGATEAEAEEARANLAEARKRRAKVTRAAEARADRSGLRARTEAEAS